MRLALDGTHDRKSETKEYQSCYKYVQINLRNTARQPLQWYRDIIKDMCGVGGTSRGDPMGAEGGVGGGQRSGELSVTLCFSLSGS